MQEDRDIFLLEMLRLEGHGGTVTCTICKTEAAMYCCRDCVAIDLYCKGCLLVAHAAQPVHMINVSRTTIDVNKHIHV